MIITRALLALPSGVCSATALLPFAPAFQRKDSRFARIVNLAYSGHKVAVITRGYCYTYGRIVNVYRVHFSVHLVKN